MKKVLFIFLFSTLFGFLQLKAQNNVQYLPVDTFLVRFNTFVFNVEKMDWARISKMERDSISNEYDCFDGEYDSYYNDLMTNKQIKKYSECKARYKKAVAIGATSKVVQRTDSIGDMVGQKIKRIISNGIGAVNGTLKKNDE